MERQKDCYQPNAMTGLAKITGKAGLLYSTVAVPLLVISALSDEHVIDGAAAIVVVLALGLLGISIVLGASWYVYGTFRNWDK